MYSAVSVVVPPAVEPVTIEQARRHCSIDSDNDDDLLAGYITAARSMAEIYCNRAFITQTLQYTLANAQLPGIGPYASIGPLIILPQWLNWGTLWQQWLELPRAPLQSVTSVSMGQWGQPEAMLAAGTDYVVDAVMQPGRVQLLNNGAVLGGQDHLSITYTAGYDGTGAALPIQIQMGILWTVAFLYENRGDTDATMPKAAENMLAQHRLVTFG